MKSLRKLLATLVLSCALCVSAFAGDIGTQGYAPGDIGTQGIATSETGTGATTTAPGDIGTPVISLTDPLTGIALSLVQSVLALF
jgi:hypothetical protein